MKSICMIACAVLMGSSAGAQPVGSFAELEGILTDQIVIEDFEGLSLHAGGTLEVPNPLNSITVQDLGFNWDLQAGVTYESPTIMSIHAGFLGGDDDVYLQSVDQVEIRFDVAQVAFGFDAIGTSGGQFYTVSVYDRDDALIEAFEVSSGGGINFIGYQAPTLGIMRVVVTHPMFSQILVNNFTFGADFVACPADINGDGVQNFFDVSAFLNLFSAGDPQADLNGDGVFNFFDVSAFLNAFSAGCP